VSEYFIVFAVWDIARDRDEKNRLRVCQRFNLEITEEDLE